jgi:hypothetical protein
VVKAGRDLGIKVMGDNLGCPDMVAGAKFIEDMGCDYVIHHIGYDERRGIAARGQHRGRCCGDGAPMSRRDNEPLFLQSHHVSHRQLPEFHLQEVSALEDQQ